MKSEIFLPAKDYDLAATLDSGQVFRWRQQNGSWIGVVGRNRVRLTQKPDGIAAETAAPVQNWDWLREFLQSDVDLGAILKTFPDDEPMNNAVAACRGLRVLRQEPWECLASFILSATKQIVQIRQIVAHLCECFGDPLQNENNHMESLRKCGIRSASTVAVVSNARPAIPPLLGEIAGVRASLSGGPADIHRTTPGHPQQQLSPASDGISEKILDYSFPACERIAAATEKELRNCKMGFRAPNLLAAARDIAEGRMDLKKIAQLPYPEAQAELMKLRGVGQKIADCVLLFAYGFDSAFPVDVWVERALQTLYFPRRRVDRKKLLHFAAAHFGPRAGYAQQYLFHYMRTHRSKTKESK